jgi:hypothetical protein
MYISVVCLFEIYRVLIEIYTEYCVFKVKSVSSNNYNRKLTVARFTSMQYQTQQAIRVRSYTNTRPLLRPAAVAAVFWTLPTTIVHVTD